MLTIVIFVVIVEIAINQLIREDLMAKAERKIPITTTIPPHIYEQIVLLAENRTWTIPQATRHALMQLFQPASKLDNEYGKGHVAERLYINPVFGSIEKRA